MVKIDTQIETAEIIPASEYNTIVINSIAEKYPKLRQRSKSPSFALQYAGTWKTLVKNLGFEEDEAKKIDEAYQEMYTASIQWTKDMLDITKANGFAELAFGLKLRPVLFHRIDMKGKTIPYEALKEQRTIGNALSQSYGMLINRAVVAVSKRLKQDNMRGKIIPCCLIHDAMYFIVDDSAETLAYLNKLLQDEITWQEDPRLKHDKLKLTGSLGVFYPSWAEETEIPIDANVEEVSTILKTIKEVS